MKSNETTFRNERFELTLFINNIIIAKRKFWIGNFIEGSMNSVNFKEKIDQIVAMIDNDLKSKSRVYTWYYYNPECPEANPDVAEEFNSPLIEPWECAFKLVITDNGHDVITKIWDGRAYPKFIRNRVDLTNRVVRLIDRDGNVTTFDKDTFFNNPEGRFTPEQLALRGMIMDKVDLLAQITKEISLACSTRGGSESLADYETTVKYGDKEYCFNMAAENSRYINSVAKDVQNKTKNYFKKA